VPIVLKSGELNRLEPSGPEEAGAGIALPARFPISLLFLLNQDTSINLLAPELFFKF